MGGDPIERTPEDEADLFRSLTEVNQLYEKALKRHAE
jgi:hypothetical protein